MYLFDLDSHDQEEIQTQLSIGGDPVPMIDGVQQSDDTGRQLAVSRIGSIAYPALRQIEESKT